MSNAIMCHVVAGYPDSKTCLQLIGGMSRSGVAAIEIQIPFSDPIADGEIIMQANDVALAGGTTSADSFALIKQARQAGVNTDLYVMSYMQKVLHFGLQEFCKQAASCRVKGLIIPDLPYDSPEFTSLQAFAAKQGLELVPVLSPGMPATRLRALLSMGPSVVYVTSQRGITGNKYAVTEQLSTLIAQVRETSDATVMVGFGINSSRDVADVLRLADVAVVGSAVIKKLQSAGIENTLNFIKQLVEESL